MQSSWVEEEHSCSADNNAMLVSANTLAVEISFWLIERERRKNWAQFFFPEQGGYGGCPQTY